MKQFKILFLASMFALFNTYANAVNIAPIISYLLSDTVQHTASNDFNMTLDVNESTVTGDWKVLSSANDTSTAVVLTHGLYGSFEVTEDSLTYTKITETNATDTGVLEITEGTKTTEIVVRINALYWSQVRTGDSHTAAIKSDGSLWAWGSNSSGKLGDGTTTDSLVPVQESTGATDWKFVNTSTYSTVAIKTDGSLWSWGLNDFGQLCDGTKVDKWVPTQEITKATDWSTVSMGIRYTIVIKSDGTLWGWGRNYYGQLGDGTFIDRLVPTQEFTGATDWSTVSAGGSHTVAIKTDGTLWAWGENYFGELGDGTRTTRKYPTQENTRATDWSTVSAGQYYNTVAIKSNGTLWGWGDNYYGQICNGETEYFNTVPSQDITQATDWNTVSVGYRHTVAIKTDGTLWGCGRNDDGELGDGTSLTLDQSVPTQEITQATDRAALNAGYRHTFAIKTDGTLWGWGNNYDGQLGVGVPTSDRLVPTQVSPREYD